VIVCDCCGDDWCDIHEMHYKDCDCDAMNDRITFRLGPLAGPLAVYCEKHGTTPSDVIRAALAKRLGVDAPEMPQGNPGIGEQAAAGAAARWKAKRKRRK
jgi:hypothetical protein